MQRQGRPAMGQARVRAEGGRALHGQVVGCDRGDPAVGDPFEQPLVVAVEHRARAPDRGIELAVGLADQLPEAGVDAHDVALLHPDAVHLHDHFQAVEADFDALIAEVMAQVDQDPASLHARLRHALDAERDRAEVALPPAAGGVHDPVAVVENLLRGIVAVRVEQRSLVGEPVPVRRVLGVEHDRLVRAHVGEARIELVEGEIEIGLPVAHDRVEHGREAVRVEDVAARPVEGMAQAERAAGLHFLERPQPPLLREQVHPAARVVIPELAPVRPGRALLPSLRHVSDP